jgi:hypothetical protein
MTSAAERLHHRLPVDCIFIVFHVVVAVAREKQVSGVGYCFLARCDAIMSHVVWCPTPAIEDTLGLRLVDSERREAVSLGWWVLVLV